MAKVKNMPADDTGGSIPVATSQQKEEEQGRRDEGTGREPGTDIAGQEPEGSGDKADSENRETEEPMDESGEGDVPKELVAVYPILYLSHQYKPGDRLPANDPGMVGAWIDAGTARWKSYKGQRPKARLAAAEPGLPGQAVGPGFGNDGTPIGKIPGRKAGK